LAYDSYRPSCRFHSYINFEFVRSLTNITRDMSNTFQLDSLPFSADGDTPIPLTIPQNEKHSRFSEFSHAPNFPDRNVHVESPLPHKSNFLFGTTGPVGRYRSDLSQSAWITAHNDTSIGLGPTGSVVSEETCLHASDINLNPIDQTWLQPTNSTLPNTSLRQSVYYDLPSQSALSMDNVGGLWDFDLRRNDIPHSAIALSKFDESVGQEVQRVDINSSCAPEDSSTMGWFNGGDCIVDVEASHVSTQPSFSNVFQAEQTEKGPDSLPGTTSTISGGETGPLILKVDKPKR
jgi:hypothetical protein